MGWSIGWDSDWNRDIGYGVVAYCDHPDCDEVIDRGLSFVCAGEEPRGGDGCGLYFCSEHHSHYRYPDDYEKIIENGGEEPEPELTLCCERCAEGKDLFTPKPEHPHWAWWKMNAVSWMAWRAALPFDERESWKRLAEQYKPTPDDIEEAEEDE